MAYEEYLGKQEVRTDRIHETPLVAMAATLDRPLAEITPDGSLPPLWHWFFFQTWVPASEIGPDGHPRRGGFMPPVHDLPRRMFAGARTQFPGKLFVGDTIKRTLTIKKIDEKQGSTGRLMFVSVHMQIEGPRGVAITEEQDIVYRGLDAPAVKPADPAAAAPSFPAGTFTRELVADPVMLFRYSALTANGHRIHYDRSYVMGEEGYPGLIVHGPLQASLLVDHLQRNRPGRRIASFGFRAQRPVFDIAPFRLVGQETGGKAALSTQDPAGNVCMKAEATIE
ncbi:MAG: MaoC family dehydratase N-terminal domain-containing protein [Alphaproteobacteria bacterium]|nr:MaoC family dehydratase N-terminal domain-containing protein [Alphaproteobacteria bacterium]